MRLTLEFGGGLELLCQSVKIHQVDVDLKAGEDKLSMRDLLVWVKSNLIKERPEMFVKGDSVRPGVLVLINDCDWELCGNLDAVLEEKDTLVIVRVFYLSLGDALLEQLSFDASHRQRDVDEARTELVWLEAADP